VQASEEHLQQSEQELPGDAEDKEKERMDNTRHMERYRGEALTKEEDK